MAKASVEIPDALIDAATKKRIKALEKEVKSLEAKLVRRDAKLKQIEAAGQQEQRAVNAINELIERVKHDGAFESHFYRDPYDYRY